MGSIKLPGNLSPKGLVLAVNTGSITTKYAVYRDGEIILDRKLEHSVQELSRFADVMDQEGMRTEAILDALKENGIELEDGIITPDDVQYVDESKKIIGITIHSGKNRIVRRIFEFLGYEVVKLDRVVFAGLTKKDLPRGKWRFLTQAEINILKMTVK